MKRWKAASWLTPCLILLAAVSFFAATQFLRQGDGKKPFDLNIAEVRHSDRQNSAESGSLYPYVRRRDVIYGRRSGTALTMDVFTPKKNANGLAIVHPVSAGWVSSQSIMDSPYFSFFLDEPVKRGYTLFAVCHSSQPAFTIPDAIADVNRAVRYIRHHSHEFAVDPNCIGVLGASSGGHLALMLGVAGEKGDPNGSDAVERTSSCVQAVACFFPPTDFLNYGEKGKLAFADDGALVELRTAIDVREFDKHTKRLERITDPEKFAELCRRVSPVSHVSRTAAPTLILHGDADTLVPIQQSEEMVAKLKEADVPAELVVKHGKKHIWPGMDQDMGTLLNWFDKQLKK